MTSQRESRLLKSSMNPNDRVEQSMRDTKMMSDDGMFWYN